MVDPFETRGIELRRATQSDDDLIRRIVALAAGWRQPHVGWGEPLSAELDAYHQGWKRPDDLGILAFSGIEWIGGAFARRVGPADGTHGYVDSSLLEIGIGVEHPHRSKGIGRLVLEALKAITLETGHLGLSLSVELDNPARRLYEAAGFLVVEERATDALMAWQLVRP